MKSLRGMPLMIISEAVEAADADELSEKFAADILSEAVEAADADEFSYPRSSDAESAAGLSTKVAIAA